MKNCAVTPFAAMSGELEKEAFLKRHIDKGWDTAWNATMKPAGKLIGDTVSGAANVAGGALRGVGAVSAAPFNALRGGAAGGWGGASQGLGGFVQGIYDGTASSAKNTASTIRSSGKQMATGAGRLSGIAPAKPAMAAKAAQPAQPAKPAKPATPAKPAATPWYKTGPGLSLREKYASLPPFAALEKDASLGKAIGSGIKGAGRFMARGSGNNAWLKPSRSYNGLMGQNPLARGAVNYGIPGAAGAGALYGSNRMGHASGRETGLGEGFDAGLGRGIAGAQAAHPGDPGPWGRILDVFRGQPDAPDARTLYGMLSKDREKLLQAILHGPS